MNSRPCNAGRGAVPGRARQSRPLFWQSVLAAILFTPFGLWFWQDPNWMQWGIALSAGVFGTLGYFLMTWSYRLLDISALQPLAFLGIVWASVFDLLFFGRTADARTFVGAAIVVAATTAIVHREARRRIA